MLSLKANDVQWKNTFIYGYSVCEARIYLTKRNEIP